MRGSGAAGLVTVGAAGVEVAQEALAETQAATEPLVPSLDTLPLGVHRRRAPRHRRRRLCPLGRLAPEAAMIGAVLGWFAGSRWAMVVAKWGAVGLTVLLFLLTVGARASAPGGWRSGWRMWRKPMAFNAGGWRRRLAGLVLAASWLGGCATGRSEPPVAAVCPPVADVDQRPTVTPIGA